VRHEVADPRHVTDVLNFGVATEAKGDAPSFLHSSRDAPAPRIQTAEDGHSAG
jgi:hypothetical protein